MSRTLNRIAVYCGSASPDDPRYIQLAYDVGRGLAERGIGVVYGGGRLGLMGATARGASRFRVDGAGATSRRSGRTLKR